MVMRAAYVHEAVLLLERGTDEREPGGAITMALCGSWSHSGPCPLAPHHTATRRSGIAVVVRVIFAAEVGDEHTVRRRIVAALGRGRAGAGSDVAPGWRLAHERAGELRVDERDHAARLASAIG